VSITQFRRFCTTEPHKAPENRRVLNPWRLRLLGLLDSLGTVRAVAETLPTPVHRNVAVVVRRGSVPRAAVDAVVEALLDHPAIPALAAHDPDHGPAPRSRAT
jgi:hypothetical protein